MTHPYASAAYARVFEGVAEPLWVPAWGAYVLVREIAGGGRDALGAYPLAPFAPDADLAAGLTWLKDKGLVSVGLVADPATTPPIAELQAAFGLSVSFKTHYLVDYAQEICFSKHHRAEVKKALRSVTTKVVALADHLPAWRALYATLVERHEIGGLTGFSGDAFERLAQVDGLTAIAAFAEGEVVSMHLWVADQATRAGYSLLAASSAEGYRRSAAYAVYDHSIRFFANLTTLNLGGGAGLRSGEDGLGFFKRGFANAEVQAWFCGAILDEARYSALSGGTTVASTPFPAYRFAKRPPEVCLRELREEDLPILHGWYQTPELWDHLVGEFTPRTEAEAVAYMRRWLSPSVTELRLGIVADGRLMGLATLSPINLEAGWAELHTFIGDRSERGHGLGRRAVAQLAARGFAMGLSRIELRVLETNTAARRVYEACGFVIAGEAPGVLVMQAAAPTSGRP